MKTKTVLWTLFAQVAFLAAAIGANAEPRECKGLRVIGLTDDQRLVAFRACKPEKTRAIGFVSGVGSGDSTLVGIDFRVQDEKLYGVGNGGGVYTLDPETAEASFVSQLSEALSGTSFGVDFNPAADRLRIVSDTGQNLRHNVALATGGTTADLPLSAPGVSGAAYTNNDLTVMGAPNTATTLFDLNASTNEIAIQSPPNNGNLVATGALGVDPGSAVGFDVYSKLGRDGMAVANRGFASLVVDGAAGFYGVNLLTGKATRIGALGDTVVDVALPLDQ